MRPGSRAWAYKPEDLRRAGYIFDTENPSELAKFKGWLRLNNLTLVVFFILLGGVFFTFFVSLAGYSASSIYHMELPSGWKIAIVMAEIFKSAFGQLGYIFFGIILIFALFDTQFTIYDGIARMGADAFFLEYPQSFGKKSYRYWYFVVLGTLVAYGVIGTFLKTPYVLWLIAAWLTTPAQVFVTYMVITLNRKLLPEKIRPKGLSVAINLIWATLLLVYFIVWTIKDRPF